MGRYTTMAGEKRTTDINVFRDIVLPSAGLPLRSSYTIAEVAQMFDVTPRTIYTYIKNGTCGLRAVKVRGSLRIFRADLERAFAEVEIKSAQTGT